MTVYKCGVTSHFVIS